MPSMKDMNSAGPEFLALRAPEKPGTLECLQNRIYSQITLIADQGVLIAELQGKIIGLEKALAEKEQKLQLAVTSIDRLNKICARKTEDLATLQALTTAALEAKETGKPATVDWPIDRKPNSFWVNAAADKVAELQAGDLGLGELRVITTHRPVKINGIDLGAGESVKVEPRQRKHAMDVNCQCRDCGISEYSVAHGASPFCLGKKD